MPEWLNGAVSKTVEPHCGSESSNLSLSAKVNLSYLLFYLVLLDSLKIARNRARTENRKDIINREQAESNFNLPGMKFNSPCASIESQSDG